MSLRRVIVKTLLGEAEEDERVILRGRHFELGRAEQIGSW